MANHNSLIDITLRLGWLGLALFLAMLVSLWNVASTTKMARQAAILVSMILISCALNPMLETARAAVFMAFAFGHLKALGTAQQRARDAPGDPAIPIEHSLSAFQPQELGATPAARRKALAAKQSLHA